MIGDAINREIVYVLTNEYMPGLVKIGRTGRENLQSRLNELHSTGVPWPFKCVYACEVDTSLNVEQALISAFGDHRVHPRREFFELEPERVIVVLRLLSLREVTPEVEQEITESLDSEDRQLLEKPSKRPRMNFREMGIPIGSELVYRDDSSIRVRVADDRRVEFDGETTYLTSVTSQLMRIPYKVQPSPYWMCEGQSLKDIYDATYVLDGEA